MSMMAFHLLFPEEAKNKSRTVTPVNLGNLPGHTFIFMEFYCVDPGCDCRRVMINVIDTENDEHVATINHAFGPPKQARSRKRRTQQRGILHTTAPVPDPTPPAFSAPLCGSAPEPNRKTLA